MTEIKIKRKLLLETLLRLRSTFAKKNALPILNDYLFSVDGQRLSITATDYETVSVETFILPKENISLGEKSRNKWCVNRHYLIPGLRTLDDEEITLLVGDYQISVRHGSGVFKIATEDSSEYPAISDMISDNAPVVNHLKLEAPGLSRWMRILGGCISQDDLRPVMEGIYFDCTPKGLTMCASDGYRLVTIRKESITTDQDENIIMPRKVVRVLSSVLPKTGEVEFFFQTYHEATLPYGKIRFQIGNEEDHIFEIRFRGIEGRYPNYNSVIPQNNDIIMSVDRQKFVRLMRRAIVFANDSCMMVEMTVEKDRIKILSKDTDFETFCEDGMPCEAKGNTSRLPMRIGLKIPIVIELTEKLKTSTILLKFSDPLHAVLIEPEPQPDTEQLTMLSIPMLVTEEY